MARKCFKGKIASRVLQRIPSGIPGFDEMIGGGFLPGNAVAITGDAGAGKTLFSLQAFLNRKYSEDKQGLIISFEENAKEISDICKSLDYKYGPFVKILYFSPGLMKQNKLLGRIKSELRKNKVKGLLLNSLTKINSPAAKSDEFQTGLYNLIKQYYAEAIICFQGESALPLKTFDSVINLSIDRAGSRVERKLQVLKMRGSTYEEVPVECEITASGFVTGFVRGGTAVKANEVNAAISFHDIDIDSKILQGFRSQHPDLNLRFLKSEFEGGDYYQRTEEIKTSIRLGEFKYDIISCSLYEIKELAREKLILPISDYFVKSVEEEFFKVVREVCSYEGQLYSLPNHISPLSLIYRKDIFKKHGMKVPETSAELIDVLKILLEKEKSFKHGIVFPGGRALRHCFYTYFLTGAQDFKKIEGSIEEINCEMSRNALKFLYDCTYKHKIAPEIAVNEAQEECAKRVIKGEALCTEWWACSEIGAMMKKNKELGEILGFETIPVFHPKAAPVSIIHGGGYVIPVTSKNPVGAAEVIRYLSGYEAGKIIKIIGNYPTLSGRIDLWEELEQKIPYYMNAVKFLETAYSLGEVLQREEYSKTVLECVQDTLLKKKSLNDSLNIAGEKLKRWKRISFYYRAVEDAKKFIERNHSSKLKLSDISKSVNLSPHFFSRIFRENSGKTVFKYLLEVRLDRAKKLLKENYRLNITQIAGKTGFSNVFHFGTVFKKHTGTTPREYRLNNQESAGVAKRAIF